jgi:hypothetical protein
MPNQALLLVLAVGAVGVLHTMVPDHWAPIALLARQYGWSKAHTARAAALAGTGHVFSTLVIAGLLWGAGALLAARFAHTITLLSSLALIAFGAWIAIGSWRELRQAHDHSHTGHAHVHRHVDGVEHRHWHEHHAEEWHMAGGEAALAPLHEHTHATSSRTALLLIIGSSPMIEGIPAFFAASRYGAPLLGIMALVFAVATITTYIVLCVASSSGMERLNLGRFEQYGEILSGTLIALLGAVFLLLPGQ